MKNRPLLFIVIAFLFGHLAASMQQLELWLLTLMGTVLLLSCTLLLKQCTLKLAGICLLLFVAGSGERYFVDVRNVTALPEQLLEASVQATGVIVSEVELDGDRAKFLFQSSELALNGAEQSLEQSEKFMVHVTLLTEEELLEAKQLWHRGIVIQLAGELSVPEEASNEGAFDYRLYLQRQGIHWLWKSKGSSNVEVLKQARHVSSLYHNIDEIRKKLAAPLDSLYSATESGYLKGLILGIREDLDPEQFRSFSTLGLTHILAISGLHVAVFMYMVTALLKLLRCSKEQIIYALLVTIPCYVALTGASPSVLRAGMMAMIGLFAARAGRLKDGLHIIAVVAAILVLWDPYMLHNVSFQLSFIVTLGLIIGVPAIQCLFPPSKRWKWAYDLLAVTLVAQIISFPVTIYYFNQFHILSLLANFFLVPFISTIVMPLASFGLLLGHISLVIAKPVSIIVHWCNELSFAIVTVLGEVDQLHTIWATPPLIWIILWYSIWIAIFHYWKTKRSIVLAEASPSDDTEPIDVIDELSPIYYRRSEGWLKRHYQALLYTLLVTLLMVYAYMPEGLDRTATISFLDVGQGDASLIRTPTGKIIVIDGGGTLKFGEQEAWKQRKDPFEVGKKVLLPLLMKRGVHEIDLLILSHLDSDHIGGLFEVVRQIPVKEVWWNGSFDATGDAEKLFSLIMEKQIPLSSPLIGDIVSIDAYTTFNMLWPLHEIPSNIESIKQQNEQSLVFLLTVYDSTFLYTGDIGKETEELIVNMHAAKVREGLLHPLPTISVLKAAHHGSRYSTDYSWLSYTQPLNTVISAGRNNRYGHPHPDVLDRLSQYNSLVWRIDQQGEVMFKVNKNQLYYRKWK